MKRKLTDLFTGCLIGALMLPGLAHAAPPLRIGVSLGLTGKYAAPAAMQERAFALWRDEVNAAGGILGRNVELVILNDESSAAKAEAAYRTLIEEQRVDHVFGPYSSALTAAVAPIVERARYPMLAAGAAADHIWEQGYAYIFGMWASASRYSDPMLELALIHGCRRVAVVHADDPFAKDVGRGAIRWARTVRLDVVLAVAFEKGRRDLVPVARQVAQSQAQLLIVGGHLNEALDMRTALQKIGWYPGAYHATVGPALAAYRERLGAHAERTFATSIWEPTVAYPGSQAFSAAFENRHGLAPSYHAATAYAAGQILRTAVVNARTAAREAVKETLHALDTYSVIGRFSVDRTGRQVKSFPLIVQWQQGTKHVVWPEGSFFSNKKALIDEDCAPRGGR